MSVAHILRAVPVERTARVMQLEGMFEVPPSERSEQAWDVSLDLPADWKIGLIVGPSGSGKSTVARELFGDQMVHGYNWPDSQAVVDGFPKSLSIKDITAALSSVGFSSPPAWLRPFRCLSNGEQFRATLARALVEPQSLVVVDEFTSVVDRQVAQIGSAAVAKAVRRTPGKQFIAVTCHADVESWLDPDWVLEMPLATFARRSLRGRPKISLEITRVHYSAWKLFKHHHYLDTTLHRSAKCFVACVDGRPAAFASSLHTAGKKSYWREHRTVCLPDFQGVGIGNALSEFVAGVMAAKGKPYCSTTSNPSMIRHRAKSPLWVMARKPGLVSNTTERKKKGSRHGGHAATRATNRMTCGFRYVGPILRQEAAAFGV